MAGTDLFTWMDAVWTKTQPQGTPPIFMMHRFLASRADFARAARYIQDDVREAPLAFRVWQGLAPRAGSAPRFSYVVAKKPPKAEELTIRMMEVLGDRRSVVEEMQAVVALAGEPNALYLYFGIEPPEEEETVEEKPRTAGGLLDSL